MISFPLNLKYSFWYTSGNCSYPSSIISCFFVIFQIAPITFDPFFRAGKLGVSIVLRSTDQKKIDLCNEQILRFVKSKNIEILREI